MESQQHVRSESKRLKAKGGRMSGYLSTWPAHASAQIVQHCAPAPSGVKRDHGYGEEFEVKPRLLEQLECYLKKELASLDMSSPKLQEHKLQAYQEVFNYFIENFKAYKPLLSAIKNEYDTTLVLLREQIRELEPLRAQLVLLSEQCEKRILELREQERAEIRNLKQKYQQLQQLITSMKDQQRGLETQVSHLQKELAAQYLLYREERDAHKLLIANISSMRYSPDQMPDKEHSEMESEDPVTVNLALKVCREDLTKAQVELNRLHAEYGDVVPRRDWENLDCMYKENLLKLETLQSDFNQMKLEYDTLLDLHQQVSMQRDSLQNELEVFKEASTPRPRWEQCSGVLGDKEHWSELFEGQSSQNRLETLLNELKRMGLDQSDLFTGLGTSSDVPIYLRFEGQLRNLKLKKEDVVRVIKDIWRGKASKDEKMDKNSDIKEFLYQHLVEQHGEQAGEWAYSLMDGIKRYQKDDFIGLFYDILTGRVDESVYRGQTNLLSHLLKVLIKGDSTESGLLTAAQFSEALRAAFPLKEEKAIEELVQAAQTELKPSEGNIAYQRLYTADTDGKHGEFLALVKMQALSERHQYISQLRGQLEDKEDVTVEDLKTAFKNIDPSLNSATLEWYLSIAFKTKELHSHTSFLDKEAALQCLSVADVNRAGLMV
ncbi:translin-associated factor X-interacting protein 1 isoform X2 [Trichomycterus rosablanca]